MAAEKVADPVGDPPEPGMRRVEMWVWDPDSPAYRHTLERSAAAMRARAGSAEERELMDWSEATAAAVERALLFMFGLRVH